MIVYFITCHNSGNYVMDLLSYIFREGDTFIFHCDPKSPIELKNTLQKLERSYSNVLLLRQRPYSWAGYSQVRATLDAMYFALERGDSWSHFIPLSEAHLPTMRPEAIDDLLAGRGSLVGVRSVKGMGSEKRSDIASRFRVKYKELSGVGSFFDGIRNDEPVDIDELYHGSNWYIISRKHCQFVLKQNNIGAFRQFENAVHADENAIQTIVHSQESLAVDDCENIETTFVAAPHLTDNPHLVMVEANFWTAVDRKIPFIRKRDVEIPQAIKDFLGDVGTRQISSRADDGMGHQIEDPRLKLRQTIKGRIEAHLKRKKVGCETNCFEGSPYFYMRVAFRDDSLLSINVLSEDLVDFKVLLAQRHDFERFFDPYSTFDCEVSLIRARIHDLFFQKEITSSRLTRRGFITVEDGGDLQMLLALIDLQFAIAKSIQHLVPI